MKLLHLLIAIAVMLGVATLWLRNSLVRSEGLRDHVTKKIKEDFYVPEVREDIEKIEAVPQRVKEIFREIKEKRDEINRNLQFIIDEQLTDFVDGRIDAKIGRGGIEEKIVDLRDAIRDIKDETKKLRVDLEEDRKDDFQYASETPVTPV